MDFIKCILRNAIKGFLICTCLLFLVALGGLYFVMTDKVVPTTGWFLRGMFLFLFLAIGGAIVGSGCTRPVRESKKLLSILLVIASVLLSLIIPIGIGLTIGIETPKSASEFINLILLFILWPFLTALITGIQQVSYYKKEL